MVGDILDGDYVNDLVKKAADFGNGKIHIIVNNAGFTWDGVIHKVRRRRLRPHPPPPPSSSVLTTTPDDR